jgi:hypothetical protein
MKIAKPTDDVYNCHKELIEKYVFKKKHLTSSFLDTVGLPVT